MPSNRDRDDEVADSRTATYYRCATWDVGRYVSLQISRVDTPDQLGTRLWPTRFDEHILRPTRQNKTMLARTLSNRLTASTVTMLAIQRAISRLSLVPRIWQPAKNAARTVNSRRHAYS